MSAFDPIRRATLSDDGVYRYILERDWTPSGQKPVTLLLGMLNPSVADGSQDDPTIRKGYGFARPKGFTRLLVANMFAFKATDPAVLYAALLAGMDVVGPQNDEHIRAALEQADRVVVAWGAIRPVAYARAGEMQRLLCGHDLWAIGRTKNGDPRHPLMTPYSTPWTRWPDANGASRV